MPEHEFNPEELMQQAFMFLDFQCPSCHKRWGWHGQLKDRPTDSRCPRCRPKPAPAQDLIPISKGGEHVRENVRPACPKCNFRKGAG